MTQLQDITSPMTRLERRATFSLASVYAVRMLGLFMLMPVLSLFSKQLDHASPFLIGLAISIYGLTQAIFQIPFGLWSDRFGRKRLILIGLGLFCLGSVVAAFSNSIYGVIAGRALQGSGAIAAVVMALLADLTQEVHRTKAMATIGASIGLAFGLAIVLGPLLASYIGLQGLFLLIAGLAIIAELLVMFAIPNPLQVSFHREAEIETSQIITILKNKELLRLNYGIFSLHLILTASFVVMPLLIKEAGLLARDHWQVYLPIFVGSMIVMIPFVILAEKKRQMKPVFLGAIVSLMVADSGLYVFHQQLWLLAVFLGVFFCGFNLLEATLPSLISKTAPADLRGTAMGIYSTSQFMGAFIGGISGGWLLGQFGASAVFIVCVAVALIWLCVAWFMQPPRYLANMLISLVGIDKKQASEFAAQVLAVSGIEEAKLHFEDQVAYLKIDKQYFQIEQLQNLVTQWTTVET